MIPVCNFCGQCALLFCCGHADESCCIHAPCTLLVFLSCHVVAPLTVSKLVMFFFLTSFITFSFLTFRLRRRDGHVSAGRVCLLRKM